MKLILTDIDEAVLKYHEALEKWVRKNPDILDSLSILMPDERNHLSLKQSMMTWLRTDEKRIDVLVGIFAKTEEFRDIKPGWDSETYIPKLHEEGYKFVAITAAGTDSLVKESRIHNLEKYFPRMFTAVHCISHYESKEDYLKLYQPAWWVEDRIDNGLLGRRHGHKVWIISNETNKGPLPCGMKRTHTWRNIYECLTDRECEILGWMC